ncbi:MAG TPA: hypothetical protein VFA57_19350 [Pseudolabrys sp.]|jgi:hypothetical protein|nr:hypothetical protein [Pseudolabrys sp.]
MWRWCVALVGLLAALPAFAGEMTAADARRFIVGKMFYYTCFEGTRGQGRVYPDGSVAGSIQIRGAGQVHYAVLPPGTLRVNGESVCASLRGLPIQPCFNLEQIDNESFRGSIAGLGFAYCEFTRRHERAHVLHRATHQAEPMLLRPSLTAERD